MNLLPLTYGCCFSCAATESLFTSIVHMVYHQPELSGTVCMQLRLAAGLLALAVEMSPKWCSWWLQLPSADVGEELQEDEGSSSMIMLWHPQDLEEKTLHLHVHPTLTSAKRRGGKRQMCRRSINFCPVRHLEGVLWVPLMWLDGTNQ